MLSTRRLSLTAWLISSLACACAGEITDPGVGADAGSPTDPVPALFEVPRGEALEGGYFAHPYPSDIRLRGDGTIDFEGMPRPNAVFEDYLDIIGQAQRGFGRSSAIYLRFAAALDAETLPENEAVSLASSASVYLVDVDPDSPERGRRFPIQVQFGAAGGEFIGPNWLGVLPYPGIVLAEGRTYAVVVTDRVRGAGGGPVSRSEDFEHMLSGDGGGADVERARDLYAPLLDWLDEEGGDERDNVVTATVFTTQETTHTLRDIRRVIWRDVEEPEIRELEWAGTAEHFVRYVGRFDVPNFQRGEFPYRGVENGGDIELDDSGDPVLQGMLDLRFALTVPRSRDVPEAGWPVVLYAHGTGGDYQTFVRNGTAERLAREGMAAISIDQPFHGDRYQGNEAITFFNYQNPLAARGNVIQGALEDFQLLRLARNIDVTERRRGGRTIRFDPEAIYFFGHSQGAMTGIPFAASEPLVDAAVFSGAAGLLYLTMLTKLEPFDVKSTMELILRDRPLDRFNVALALLQAFFEPADGAGYGHLLVDVPPEGVGAKNVLLTEGFHDLYTPTPTIEAMATAIGVDLVQPTVAAVRGLELRQREVLSVPVAKNRGDVTAALLQYHQAEGSDGHFVAFDIEAARVQTIQFLSTHVRSGTAEVVAP